MFEPTTSRRRVRRGIALLALAASSLVCEAARAEASQADKQAARELMAKGRAQRDAGNLQGALESFSSAHAIMHAPTTLLEMAETQVALGRWLEALALVRQLQATPAQPDDPAPFTRARVEAEELGRKLEMRMPTLRLDLTGSPHPESTRIAIDGTLRADCTQACWLNPGNHALVARSGSAQAEEQLSAVEGETLKLELVFSPELPDPRQVRPIGEEAPKPSAASDRAPASRLPTAVWVLGGVAAAGVASGVVLGLSAVSERNTLRDSCAPRCSTEQVDGVRQRALVANISFGVGAAAAAAAVAAYLFQPAAVAPTSRGAEHAPAGRVRFWGAAERSGGYVALQGSFY